MADEPGEKVTNRGMILAGALLMLALVALSLGTCFNRAHAQQASREQPKPEADDMLCTAAIAKVKADTGQFGGNTVCMTAWRLDGWRVYVTVDSSIFVMKASFSGTGMSLSAPKEVP